MNVNSIKDLLFSTCRKFADGVTTSVTWLGRQVSWLLKGGTDALKAVGEGIKNAFLWIATKVSNLWGNVRPHLKSVGRGILACVNVPAGMALTAGVFALGMDTARCDKPVYDKLRVFSSRVAYVVAGAFALYGFQNGWFTPVFPLS